MSMHLPIIVGTVPYRRPPYLMSNARLYPDEYFGGAQFLPVIPPPYRENPTPPPPLDGKRLSVCHRIIKEVVDNWRIL